MGNSYRDSSYGMSKGKIATICIAVVVLIVAIASLLMITWVSVPPDKIALHYTGGPIQGTHFVEVVQPGTGTKAYGLLENMYMLPSTQRTYIISKDPNEGDKKGVDFIAAPSSDNVPFTFEVAVYFKLNTKPETLRQFFEQVCLHDDCWDLDPGKGWDQMLAQYFKPAIDNALRLEAGKYDREHLYHDPNTLVAIQNAVGSSLKDRINNAVGGEYFCGPDSNDNTCTNFGVVVKNPTPPENVVQEYGNTAAAQQHVNTEQSNADAKVKAATGDADAQNARANAKPLTQEQLDYIRAQAMQACATNNNCTLVITDGGTNVNVNTGKNPTTTAAPQK